MTHGHGPQGGDRLRQGVWGSSVAVESNGEKLGHKIKFLKSMCKIISGPWLVWLSGLSTGLRTKGSLVQFPDGAHAWVVG